MKPLAPEFYARDPLGLAPELLGKVVVAGDCSGRIVEVEAYWGAQDPGSHGHRGPTPRNEVMFGPAGRLYVYFTYGMHWCCNVVAGDDGECAAVLIRALEPLSGIELMRERRGTKRRLADLCSGPAKLTQALAIDGSHRGVDLISGRGGVALFDDGTAPPDEIGCGPRIGLSHGVDLPWRFFVCDDPNLSR